MCYVVFMRCMVKSCVLPVVTSFKSTEVDRGRIVTSIQLQAGGEPSHRNKTQTNKGTPFLSEGVADFDDSDSDPMQSRRLE